MDIDNNNNKCPLTKLKESMIRSSKDWSMTTFDAWQYGIIVGWDKPSIKYLKKHFGWSKEDVHLLIDLHNTFSNMMK